MVSRHYTNLSVLCEYIFISAPMPKPDNGIDVKLFDTALSVQWVNEDTTHSGSNKKKRRIGVLSGKGGDDSDEDINLVPPPNDIYRSRQQKRVSK